MPRVAEPIDDMTVESAMKWVKGVAKFVSYIAAMVGAVIYVTRYVDKIEVSLKQINSSLQYKVSVADMNHAFKMLGDQNRDVIHKDGSVGMLVPEIVLPPERKVPPE